MPKLSVVLATYNGETYIKEQLDSILDQDFQDFEVIIVDDQSTDQTVKIINDLNDTRISVQVNEQNLGVQGNFEKGMALATGDYIILGDQDDHWDNHKFSRLLEVIQQQNALMVYSNARIIDEHSVATGKTLKDYNSLLGTTEFSDLFLFNSFVWGCTSIIDRKLFELANPFPKTYFSHDWWLSFTAAQHNDLYYLDEILGCWRVHTQNFSVEKKQGKCPKILNSGARKKRRQQQQALFETLLQRNIPAPQQNIAKAGAGALKGPLSRVQFFLKHKNSAFARYPESQRLKMALAKVL